MQSLRSLNLSQGWQILWIKWLIGCLMSMRCIRSLTSPLLPISSPRLIVLLCSFPLACSISPALSCPLLISHSLCLHFHQPCSPTSSASTMLLLIWIWACTQAGFCYWIPSIKLHLFFWLLHTWLKDHETHFAIFSWDGGICCWNCKLLRDSPADFQTLFNSSDFLCCGREPPVMLRQLLSFICHDSWCLDKLTHCVGSCNLSCAETWSSKGERPSLLLFASTNLAVVFSLSCTNPIWDLGSRIDWPFPAVPSTKRSMDLLRHLGKGTGSGQGALAEFTPMATVSLNLN